MSSNTSTFEIWISRADDAMASNRNEDALVFLERALDVRPRDTDALNAKGTLLGRLKRYDEAIASFEKALVEIPENAELNYNIAYSFQCMKRFGEAIGRYDDALQLKSAYPEALTNKALCLDAVGRYEDAVASASQAVRLSPGDPRFLNNLGHTQLKLRDLEPARQSFESALRANPNYVDARSNLARCLVLSGWPEEAITHLSAALAINPGHAKAVEGLGVVFRVLERYDDLVSACRSLTQVAPQAPAPWVELGAALAHLNRRDEANDCLRRARALDPNDAMTFLRIGRAQLELGDLDKAEEAFAEACRLQPNSPYFMNLLLGVKKTASGSGIIDALKRIERASDGLDLHDRAHLHFAFGKALADTADEEGSFAHLIEANNYERRRLRYDEAATLSALSSIGDMFTRDLIERCRIGGDPSKAPIFVLGMPRSGSTLVEQMLSAHPHVLGLGELRSFDLAVHALDPPKGSIFPGWLGSLAPDDVSAIARRYLSRLHAIAQGQRTKDVTADRRLVDKSPGNFRYAGLIHLALPNARIVHTRRDPVDTCLSCFRLLFDDMPFAYDLGELGRYYRRYEDLMATWDSVLPKGTILHVDYEELVADFETVARRIIAHCGLEWDEACLAFQDVQRPVRTVSAVQVRQPLMRGRKPWRPPEDILRPLVEALGPR